MATRKKAAAKAEPTEPVSLLKRAKAAEPAVFGDMAALAKKYGDEELFRTVAQRWIARQREISAAARAIAQQEQELERLRRRFESKRRRK